MMRPPASENMYTRVKIDLTLVGNSINQSKNLDVQTVADFDKSKVMAGSKHHQLRVVACPGTGA